MPNGRLSTAENSSDLSRYYSVGFAIPGFRDGFHRGRVEALPRTCWVPFDNALGASGGFFASVGRRVVLTLAS
jgi:hypothetical protein